MPGTGLSGMEVGAIISSRPCYMNSCMNGRLTESRTRTDNFPIMSTEVALPILSIMASCDEVMN